MQRTESNYWLRRRVGRRSLLKGAGTVAVGGLAIPLVGCGDDDDTGGPSATSTSPVGPGATPSEAPVRGGTFTTSNQFVQADFFDVHQTNSSGVQALAQYTHDGLYILDEPTEGDFQVRPHVVAETEHSDDTTLILKVRPDVKFANLAPVDGRALTAEDVSFSLQRMATDDPRFIRRSWFQSVERWEVLDSTTLRLTTSQPDAALPFLLAHPWTLIVASEQVEADGEQLQSLVGSGPYVLKDIQIGTEANMERNPDYWLPDRPFLDSWKFVNISDTAARMAAFRGGQLDYTDVPPDLVSKFRDDNPNTPEIEVGIVGIHLIGFNLRRPPYNDPRVRKAIAHAVDLDGWIDAIMNGDGRRTGPMSAAFKRWSLDPEQLLYRDQNIQEARQLLQAAEVEDGFTLKTFSIGTLPRWINQAVQMKEDLREVGIEVEIEQLPIADYVRRLFVQQDFDVVNGADFASEDPGNLRDRYQTGRSANWSGYSNEEVDRLFDQQAVTMNYEERKSIVDEIQVKMMEDVASHFAMIQTGHFFYNPKLRNFRLSPMNGTAERWDARETFLVS